MSAYPPFVAGVPAVTDLPIPPTSPDGTASVPMHPVPMFQFRAVNDFVASVARSGTLAIGRLKRSINQAMAARGSPDCPPVAPSALDLTAMYRPDMYASGSILLPLVDHPLRCVPSLLPARLLRCVHDPLPWSRFLGPLPREPSLRLNVFRFRIFAGWLPQGRVHHRCHYFHYPCAYASPVQPSERRHPAVRPRLRPQLTRH